MISLAYFSVFALILACAASAVEEVQPKETSRGPEDVAQPTNEGYVILNGFKVFPNPLRIDADTLVERSRRTPVESNEIENEGGNRRPLFYFTTYEPGQRVPEGGLPNNRPYIEIRRKRELKDSEIPESSKVGKLRRKRTYCRKCGGGGYGGGYYAVPVTYSVYPVYYGGGGGGKGCYSCGRGGYGGYGGGGGGGGSFSYSSSSSHSSAGSFGWGKK